MLKDNFPSPFLNVCSNGADNEVNLQAMFCSFHEENHALFLGKDPLEYLAGDQMEGTQVILPDVPLLAETLQCLVAKEVKKNVHFVLIVAHSNFSHVWQQLREKRNLQFFKFQAARRKSGLNKKTKEAFIAISFGHEITRTSQ